MTPVATLIAGVVRNEHGKPVAGARIAFTAGPVALPDLAMLSDAGGRFTLSAPAPGRYTVQCVADGYSPESRTVTARGATRVEVYFALSRSQS